MTPYSAGQASKVRQVRRGRTPRPGTVKHAPGLGTGGCTALTSPLQPSPWPRTQHSSAAGNGRSFTYCTQILETFIRKIKNESNQDQFVFWLAESIPIQLKYFGINSHRDAAGNALVAVQGGLAAHRLRVRQRLRHAAVLRLPPRPRRRLRCLWCDINPCPSAPPSSAGFQK